MAESSWSPEQYARFAKERRAPFYDLLSLVQERPRMKVIDLGCGTGELTHALHDSLGAETTLGIDSSETMLQQSTGFAADGLHFEQRDIAKAEGSYDLVFSNAAIHWLGDHPSLFAQLVQLLRPGGQLAIQIPAMFDWHTHTAAKLVAGEEPYREALGGYLKEGVLEPEQYATLFHRLGFREQLVRLQIYGHLLDSRQDVVEWVKGALLTGYQRRMPDDLWPGFMDRYREKLFGLLDDEKPFFLPYRRILMWGAL